MRYAAALWLMLCCGALAAATLDQALEAGADNQRQAAQAQAQIDKLAAENTKAIAEYRQVLQETARLQAANAQLRRLLADQTQDAQSVQQQLGSVDETRQALLPLLAQMLAVLKEFVALDVPFLAKERAQRLQVLHELLDESSLPLLEKYRRVVEAYQVESGYGRSVEAYEGALGAEADARQVQLLRVGRVALFYLTFDGDEAGYWDAQTKSWQPLEARYHQALGQAMRVARQQVPPQLLTLPVPAPQAAKQEPQS